MATPAEVQTLANDSACVTACLSEKQLLALAVFLLWDQINPGVPMTAAEVQTLSDDSACIVACMSHKMLLAAMVQLLFEGGGGGGGGGQIYDGAAPPAAPTDPTQAAIFYPDNDALPLQVWNTTTQAWRDV